MANELLDAFVRKYGTKGPSLIIRALIQQVRERENPKDAELLEVAEELAMNLGQVLEE